MSRETPRSIAEEIADSYAPGPDTRAIEAAFYRRFDDAYFYKKALTLYHGLQNKDALLLFFQTDPGGLMGSDDSVVDMLKVEIHLAELDLTELLFAFLVAPFQPMPHPVFMAGYRRDLVRWAIDRFIAGDAAALSNETLRTRAELIEWSLYARLVPAQRGEEWARNLANITRLLEIAGQRYLNASELKPLARGLHIRRDETETARFLDGPEADAAREGLTEWVAYHRTRRRKDGKASFYRMIKAVSPERSVNLVYMMTMLLRSLRETRLARLEGRSRAPIHSLASIDAAMLDKLPPGDEIRTRIGVVDGTSIE
ncbi:MAG: hypothetical protein AB7P52_01955 [Alphaproteobacteria bacterium]